MMSEKPTAEMVERARAVLLPCIPSCPYHGPPSEHSEWCCGHPRRRDAIASALADERARALADRDAQWRAGLNLTDADFDGFTMEELCEIVEGGRRCAETAHRLIQEHLRNMTLEEAAKVAEDFQFSLSWRHSDAQTAVIIGKAIRALSRGDEKA
jgi:hypothetical protein